MTRRYSRSEAGRPTWRLPAWAAGLFDRLYVLRNQLQHGGSTQAGSSLNRRQVEAGAAVMARLIPTFIGVIIDNPDADWGRPYFPPVFDA